MVILLVKRVKPDYNLFNTVYHSSWALSGGNNPQVLIPILTYICTALASTQSADAAQIALGEQQLREWRMYAEAVAVSESPNQQWSAKEVSFYHVPNTFGRMRFFRGLRGEEFCAYWTNRTDAYTHFSLANEISMRDVPAYM